MTALAERVILDSFRSGRLHPGSMRAHSIARGVGRLSQLALLAASCLAAAQAGKAAAKPAPGVDWQGEVVRATGAGPPDVNAANSAQARLAAEKAARADAERGVLAQVKGIQISAGNTVGGAMSDDGLRGRVETAVRGFITTSKRYYSDMGVEIDVELPLAALTEVFTQAAAPAPRRAEGARKVTGLLVDARGWKVAPALQPRLLDDAGNTIYGVESLSPEARKSSTVAGYLPSMERARKSFRLGERPMVVKASAVRGTDIVLGAEDAKKVGDAPYLAEGRVIVVSD